MYFLVFIAVALAGLTVLLSIGRLPASREDAQPLAAGGPSGGGLVEADPVLPPVLLPEHPGRADVERIRFSAGLRGYRMDQVDEVLEVLGRALEDRDRIIAALRAPAAPAAGQPPVPVDVKDAVQD